MADEEQCTGGTYPQGALSTNIADYDYDGFRKDVVVAMIGEEAESQWQDVKIETEEKPAVAANYALFRKIQKNENDTVGMTMLMDNGQGESGEPKLEMRSDERDGDQLEKKVKQKKRSKEYISARKQRNQKRQAVNKKKKKRNSNRKSTKKSDVDVAYEPRDAEDEMPVLLARPESDVEDEMSENEFEMPDLLYRDESSESEDEIHAQKPARKRVFRRTKQQRKKTRQQEKDDSSNSEMEEYDSDGMPRLRRDPDNNKTSKWNKWPGLNPAELKTGERIGGSNKRQLRRENKAKRIEKQEGQEETTYWSSHGRRRRCMRQSTEDRMYLHWIQKQLSSYNKKFKIRSRKGRLVWCYGMRSRRIHRRSYRYRQLQ